MLTTTKATTTVLGTTAAGTVLLAEVGSAVSEGSFIDWANTISNIGMAGLVVLLLVKTGPDIISAFRESNTAVVGSIDRMTQSLSEKMDEANRRYLDLIEEELKGKKSG